MVAAGAVDGTTGEAVPTVDNFTVAENRAVLALLHQWLAEKKITL